MGRVSKELGQNVLQGMMEGLTEMGHLAEAVQGGGHGGDFPAQSNL